MAGQRGHRAQIPARRHNTAGLFRHADDPGERSVHHHGPSCEEISESSDTFLYASDSGGGSGEPAGPAVPPKPKDEVPEDVFWDNVGKLISTAKPGDIIKVKPGLFENLPPSIEGLLQTYPGITLELTYNDGRIKTLGAMSSNPNPTTGGIWEISAPGSVAVVATNIAAPSQEVVLTADHTAEPAPVPATITGETKQTLRTGLIGASLAVILLLGSSGWYLAGRRTHKRKRM